MKKLKNGTSLRIKSKMSFEIKYDKREYLLNKAFFDEPTNEKTVANEYFTTAILDNRSRYGIIEVSFNSFSDDDIVEKTAIEVIENSLIKR